ncbi:MAG: Spy/CpxP family protein refolding chaperone [Pseudomonadota bacterium]
MKPWIKKTLAGVFGATIVLGGLTACAGHRHGEMGPEKIAEIRGKVVNRVSSKLDLNDAQKVKLNALADTLQAQRAAFKGKTPDPRAEVQAIVAGATFDRARAQALMEEKTRAVQTASPEVITAMANFYDSLNPEQQQKVREMMDKRGRHGGGWMSRG